MSGNGDEGRGSQGAGGEHRHEGNGGRTDGGENLQARLERLTEALDARRRERQAQGQAQQGRDRPNSSPQALGNMLAMAFRVLSEFVAAVVVGAAIGWGIDSIAGTSPLFLIVFVLLGAAAGFWNVYRIGAGKPGRGT